VKPRFEKLHLESVLREMAEIHELFAATKGISISVESLSDVPLILGSEMEIRRLFHNVLNNAIKYSYHSVPNAQRVVKIRSKVPYNPGFAGQKNFALTFENYGLGITESEMRSIFEAGFRGRQAMAEVPIGAGIGLAEARKIMKVHGGRIKLRSTPLHEGTDGTPTYLTTVDLIFPYEGAAKRLRGKARNDY
jgi:signal transduction histidine kinase